MSPVEQTEKNVSQGERERLLAQRAEWARKLDEVRGLLAKADTRLRDDPENRKRWFGVVENLEASLNEVKARLESVETELRLLESDAPGRAPSAAAKAREGMTPIDRVLETPLEELGSLSLEEISLAEGQCRLEPDGDERAKRVSARIELANQMRETLPADDNDEIPARRAQIVLRAAIGKIQTGRIETMNAEEIRITIACYELMVRRVNPTPSDLRLKRILSGAINIFQRKKA